MNGRSFFKSRHFYAILVAFLILAALTWLHLVTLDKNFVIDQTGAIRTTYAGYGDIPLHLTQISKFAFDKLDNLNEPIYYGDKIHYPFVINLISGLLLRFTHAWRFSVLAPVLVLAIANIILLFVVYRKLIKNHVLAALAVCLFMLGSGFGGYTLVKTAIDHHQSWPSFQQELVDKNISTIVRYDAQYPQQNIVYGAPISLVFLHQRPFLLGLFGFLLFLLLLIKTIESSESRKYWIGAAIVFGLLPIAHMHTFITVAIVLGVGLLLSLFKPHRHYFKRLLLVSLIGSLIALPQLFYLVDFSQTLHNGAQFMAFRLGWMTQPTIGTVQFANGQRNVFSLAFVDFLWLNLGLILPVFLLILLGALLFRRCIFIHRQFVGPGFCLLAGLFLFLVVNLVRLQPWDYDTNKLLVYYQFFAAGAIMYVLGKLYKNHKVLGTVVITVFLFVAMSDGLLDQIPRFLVPKDRLPVIFDTNAQQLSRLILQTIPEDQLILTGTSHLNPVSSLAGRETLVGYPGWLWTRGIDYSNREAEIKAFYSNPSRDAAILKEFPVRYILLDDQVVHDLGGRLDLLQQNFALVFHVGQYYLFKI